jgi:YHS domain-containing protein
VGTKAVPPVSPPATGESKKGDEAPKIEGPKAENSKQDGGAVVLTAAEVAAVKELPAAEQAAASQQGVCPVSTKHLGSMGMPLKVSAEGRTFYICCDSCEDKVKSDPKTVIANLDKKNNAK